MKISKVIESVTVELLRKAVTTLPSDVKEVLKRAYEVEEGVGKIQLKNILDNIELAEKKQFTICQDTGTVYFYVKAGGCFKGLEKIRGALIKGVRRATVEIPLRPNAVNPLTQENSGDNTGFHIPHIYWEVVEGEEVEITVLPKGGGSENTSKYTMLKPSDGLDGVKKFVLETIIEAGAQPCPPTIIGVGLGGGADIAMKLAKTALLRPLNSHHPDRKVAEIEAELLEAANMTGIGPMGLGGKTTALAVHIEYAHRHPASYPVGIVFQCWAARRASAKILPDGSIMYST